MVFCRRRPIVSSQGSCFDSFCFGSSGCVRATSIVRTAYTRVSCSEITRTGARDSSRCSPLAIFCSLSFFFSTRPSSKEEEGFNLVRVWQRRTTFPGKCQHRYISETCERVSTHTEGGFLGGGYFLSLSPVSLSA